MTWHHRKRVQQGARFLSVSLPCLQIAGAALLFPAFEQHKPVPSLAGSVRERVPRGTPVSTYDFDEPSLDFYLDPSPVRRLAGPGKLAAWRREAGPGVLVISRDAASELGLRGASLREIAAVKGFNYSKGTWVELVALGRNLGEGGP